MKLILLNLIACFFFQAACSQKVEISIGLHTNLSFFRGNNTSGYNFFAITNTTTAYPYSNSEEYSKIVRFGPGIEGVIQRIMKDHFIAGVALAPELISGHIKIYDFNTGFTVPNQNGLTIITQTFIDVYPFIGRRFVINSYAFDIDLGLEAGIPLTAHEKTTVTSTSGNHTLIFKINRRKVFDVRPRVQFRLQKGRYGLSAGFAYGISNYTTRFFSQAYSNIIRFGIFYKL